VKKRYIIEFGTGADLHGGNQTKAAIRAIQDATSRSCLCGLEEVLQGDPLQMHVHAKIGCTDPDSIDKEAVLSAIPVGTGEIEVVPGGLCVPGLSVPEFGQGDTIQIVIAALTVWAEVDSRASDD
jgi:uncharacterized protein (TIGR02058 family)